MPLPFDLPAVSRGFALLTPAARELGCRAAVEASRALATLCGCEGSVTGRAVPSAPSPGLGVALLRLELTALPGQGWVEVDVPLCVALLDRLSGGAGDPGVAARPTPLQQAALELAALACLDAVAAIPEVAERLVPRLVRRGVEPMAGLSVELTIRLGSSTGRARLLLPHAAVRALGEGSRPCEATASALVELSLRSGAAPLCPEELDALAPGDVVLVDPFPAGRLAVVASGGLRFNGTVLDDTLHIEELRMPDASSEYPIALEVELARVPVTLGELARLEPGAVLPLPIDRRGIVALKLGDRTFARGQLVEIDGSVGVRIDSIAGGTR
jgi:type III secretion protein Q